MQNCKIEQSEPAVVQQTTAGGIQVMPTVLGNGQQIILQSLQQQLNAANGQQQMQLVPIIQGSQGTSYIVQPQASQPQIVQLPDGQTFIYHQPIAMTDTQQAQPQIVNINGNFFQIPAQQTVQQAAIQTQATPTSPQQQQTQQVVMIPQAAEPQIQQTATAVNNFVTTAPSPPPQPSTSNTPTPTPVESEEEPLYVNASESESLPSFQQILDLLYLFQNNTKEF
jgi:nuclear transcription factor Y, alpha